MAECNCKYKHDQYQNPLWYVTCLECNRQFIAPLNLAEQGQALCGCTLGYENLTENQWVFRTYCNGLGFEADHLQTMKQENTKERHKTHGSYTYNLGGKVFRRQ